MKCRVFISCGQRNDVERQVAKSICKLLEDRGFTTYLAIDVQTILDINAGIIQELKNSDCYLLVNLPREQIGETEGKVQFRGSLFSNQELAIAYSLGFEKLLMINQDGVKPEGLLRYIGVNTETFHDHHDCLQVVERALDRSRWTPDYSRRLRANNLHFFDTVIRYNSPAGSLFGWFLYLDIHNDRPDIAALEATARLSGYAQSGQSFQSSNIRSPLKATARPGFAHTIFPKSHEAFDLLCIAPDAGAGAPTTVTLGGAPPASGAYFGPAQSGVRVYLNSALDLSPMPHLPVTSGKWMFRYEFFAIDFPVLRVEIEVIVPQAFSPHKAPHTRLLSQELA